MVFTLTQTISNSPLSVGQSLSGRNLSSNQHPLPSAASFDSSSMISPDRIEVTHTRPLSRAHCLEARLVIDGRIVKFLSIRRGVYSRLVCMDLNALGPRLPLLPVGNWDHGFVKLDPDHDIPVIERTEQRELPSVCDMGTGSIDYSELGFRGKSMRSCCFPENDNVFQVSALSKGHETAVAKIVVWPTMPRGEGFYPDIEKDIRNEILFYRRLRDTKVGPKLLGLLTENHQRVIGFVMEKVEGRTANCAADLPACDESLRQLHRLGMAHRDTHLGNFMMTPDGAVIIDFGLTGFFEDEDREVECDFQGLRMSLENNAKAARQDPGFTDAELHGETEEEEDWRKFETHNCKVQMCAERLLRLNLPFGPKD